jgi:NAD(P)-dependent dehydrogenase (short-subunit alcohol dehydrogenase family)
MKRDFKNKVIVVTGASGNLGTAICKRFAKAGARIAALDINETALDKLQKALSAHKIEVLPIVCDITSKESCQSAVQKVLDKWGRIDGLANNAGITHIERYTNMDKSKGITRRVMEVNFFGSVNCTEAMLDEIRKNKGVIITISSIAGIAPLLGRTAYAASKHALHGFFESLGSELQEEGVHCLMVCPSFIQAPKDLGDAASDSIYQNKKTIGQDVSPDEIADDIYTCCLKHKKLLISGKTGRLSYFLRRFFPDFYERKMIEKLKDEL